MAPYKKEQHDKGTYRNSILCFDLKEEIKVPCATCEANIAYGGGGAYQIFIDDIKGMQLKNIIVLNKNESERLKRTGYNLTVSDEEWREIEDIFVVHIRSIEQNGYKSLTGIGIRKNIRNKKEKRVPNNFFGIRNYKRKHIKAYY